MEKKDKKNVRAFKEVFREVDLKQEFQDLQLASKEEIEDFTHILIQASQGSKVRGERGIPPLFFETILFDKIH